LQNHPRRFKPAISGGQRRDPFQKGEWKGELARPCLRGGREILDGGKDIEKLGRDVKKSKGESLLVTGTGIRLGNRLENRGNAKAGRYAGGLPHKGGE